MSYEDLSSTDQTHMKKSHLDDASGQESNQQIHDIMCYYVTLHSLGHYNLINNI